MIKEGKNHRNIFTGAHVLLITIEDSSFACGKKVTYKKLTDVKEGKIYFTKPLNVFEQSYKRLN
jgi:hypothetical protein